MVTSPRSLHPVHVFERPLTAPGLVYPCTPNEIRMQLARLPPEDVAGLWAVGLVPSTRRDCWANGRYFWGEKPTIHLLSYPASLSYRLPPHTRRHQVECGLYWELEFGMHAFREGSRWTCQWDDGDLRRFILEHVLVHEVGHHVSRMQRRREGLWGGLPYRASEQFAEDYALRWSRRRACFTCHCAEEGAH